MPGELVKIGESETQYQSVDVLIWRTLDQEAFSDLGSSVYDELTVFFETRGYTVMDIRVHDAEVL